MNIHYLMHTVLLNSKTGELVPHFVDRDSYDLSFGVPNVEPDLLIMQPAHALNLTQHILLQLEIYMKTMVTMLSGRLHPAHLHFKRCVIIMTYQSLVLAKNANVYNNFVFPELEQKTTFQRDNNLQTFYFHTHHARKV